TWDQERHLIHTCKFQNEDRWAKEDEEEEDVTNEGVSDKDEEEEEEEQEDKEEEAATTPDMDPDEEKIEAKSS
ncbi:hypothetical protein KI387_004507, partial [Taxus chinensis]